MKKYFLIYSFAMLFVLPVMGQQGSSCSDPYYIYPASDCINLVSGKYLGFMQCPTGSCSNYAMNASTTIDGSCADNDKLQAVSWAAVTATTTSFTINNNRTGAAGGTPVANAMDYVVFSGTCGSLLELGCYSVNGMGGSQLVTGLIAGQVYYILISRSGGSLSNPTNGNLCVTSSVPYVPLGNECSDAVSVNTNVTYGFNNAGASPNLAYTDGFCSSIGSENTTWYKWCAPADWVLNQKASLLIDNQICNYSGGLQIAVWNTNTNCPTASNNPYKACSSTGNTQALYFEWTAVANTCYYIAVDGYAGTACNFDLTVSCLTPPSPSIAGQTICSGNTATITISNATGSYQWYDAASGGNLLSSLPTFTSPVLNSNTTYYLQVSGAGCTSTRVPILVTVNETPQINLLNDTTITCLNPSILLAGSTSTSSTNLIYNWTSLNGNILSGSSTLNPLVNKNGTYVFNVQNSITGCSNLASLDISIDTIKPVINIASPDILTCVTTSIQLQAQGSSSGSNFSGIWTATNGGNVVSGSGGLTPTVNSIGDYNLTITNSSNGCESSGSVFVNGSDLPVVNAGLNKTLTCNSLTAVLNGTSNLQNSSMSYNWSTSDGNVVSGSSTLSPIVNKDGLYTLVSVNTLTGCSGTSNVMVFVDTVSPTISVIQPLNLDCNTSNVQIDASNSSQGNNFSYSWSTLNGTIVSGSNSLFPVVSKDGNYTLVIINNANGCSTSSIVQVDRVADILINSAVTDETCLGLKDGTISIVPSGGTGANSWVFSLNGGAFTNSGNFLNVSPGTYSIDVKDINGCGVLESVFIAEGSKLNLFADKDTICPNEQVTLNANGSQSYSWLDMNSGQIISNSNTLVVSPFVQTVYKLTGDCEPSLTTTIFIHEAPSIQAITPVEICDGDTVTITPNITGLNGTTALAWLPDPSILTNSSYEIEVKPSITTLYTFSLTDKCMRVQNGTANVIVNEKPEIKVIGDPVVCSGGTLEFSNSFHDNSMQIYTWKFDDNFQSSSIKTIVRKFDTEGNLKLTLKVINLNGCSTTDSSFTVKVLQTPFANLTSDKDSAYLLSPKIFFSAEGSSSNVTNYLWDFNGIASSNLFQTSFTFQEEGEYLIRLRVISSYLVGGKLFTCSDSAEKVIKIKAENSLYIPSAFTPNGDELNDFFKPYGTDLNDIAFEIYDRWGHKIFVTEDSKIGWNGVAIGGSDVCMNGVYVYRLLLNKSNPNNFKEIVGHFTLLK